MKGYPKWFLSLLISTMLLMWVTGGLLTPTTLVLRAEVMMPRLPGSARVLTAALHAAGGFGLAMLMGALWSVHMRSGWRRHRQRISGLILNMLLLLLNISAVGIYYLGDESLGTLVAFTHLGAGVALAGPLGWHWIRGRQARKHSQLYGKTHRLSTRQGAQMPSSHKPTHKAAPTP
ncbi:hypothetical protein [Aquabacterium sp.]|uniref:hypothetical protein n=1 Tax=Aquabacterium sp. TaxID=1872578 RepID=UPI0019914582|nr:hypothetical protein [Aquabacterium sp.]MBC7699871.1 hypothetical protein [Aquabacterium sp.]